MMKYFQNFVEVVRKNKFCKSCECEQLPKRKKLISKMLNRFERTQVSSGVRANSCSEHAHLFTNISKMMHIFKFSEHSHEIELIPEIRIQSAPKEDNCWKFQTTDNPFFVLLYEFPAETRLTVYRRLDIPKQQLQERAGGPARRYS